MSNKITDAFIWFETRLDQGQWFRRIYVIVATVSTLSAISWGKTFAMTTKMSGSDAALVLAALFAPLAAIQTFAFTDYIKSKQ